MAGQWEAKCRIVFAQEIVIDVNAGTDDEAREIAYEKILELLKVNPNVEATIKGIDLRLIDG